MKYIVIVFLYLCICSCGQNVTGIEGNENTGNEITIGTRISIISPHITDSIKWENKGWVKGDLSGEQFLCGLSFYYPKIWDNCKNTKSYFAFQDRGVNIIYPKNKNILIYGRIDCLVGGYDEIENDFDLVYKEYKNNYGHKNPYSEIPIRIKYKNLDDSLDIGKFGDENKGYPCMKRVFKNNTTTTIEYLTFVNNCSVSFNCEYPTKSAKEKISNFEDIEDLFLTILSSVEIYTYDQIACEVRSDR